jgi:hypothetical protein
MGASPEIKAKYPNSREGTEIKNRVGLRNDRKPRSLAGSIDDAEMIRDPFLGRRL